MTFFKIIKYCLTTFLLMTLLSVSDFTYADELGYSVQAVIPENQIDQSKTYFDLKMEPGQTQDIELEIKSSSSETLNLEVVPHIGTTSQNGELEYSVEPEKNDSTLIYPMTRLISGKQMVTLKPKETKRVTFRLKMPKKAFEGKIVGGFNVYDQENNKTTDSASKKNDVQIKNVFSMVIGIQLRENLEKVEPELKLNTVRASLFNYRTAVTANIQNIKPEFISELTVSAKVRKSGSEKIVYETEKSDMAMAPNSNFNFPILLENQEIAAGNYELELAAHSKTGEWQFSKKFRITEDEADQLNEEAIEVEKPESNKWMIVIAIAVGIVFVLLFGIIIVLWRRRK